MTFVAGVFAALCLFGLLLKVLASAQRGSIGLELRRKIAHVAMGFVCLTFPLFVDSAWKASALGVAFLVLLAALRFRPAFFGRGSDLFCKSRRDSEGEFYFVGGIVFALLFARNDAFIYSSCVMVLAIADVAASFIGRRLGRLRLWGNQKTMEGSIAFAVAAALCIWGCVTVTGNRIDIAPLMAICLPAAVAEGLANRGSDNLWIPVTIVIGLQLQRWSPNPHLATGLVVALAGGITAVRTSLVRSGLVSLRPSER